LAELQKKTQFANSSQQSERAAPHESEAARADLVWIVHGENDDVCRLRRGNREGRVGATGFF
jgi:hypothetical protein